jgi:hypothetical protein
MEATDPDSVSYLEITRLLIVKPLTAFKLILEKNENMPQVIILGLFGMLNAITPILLNNTIDGVRVFELIFKGAIGAVAGWFLVWFMALLTNAANNILKLESDSDDVFYIFSFSFVPLIFTMLFIIILRFLSAPLALNFASILFLFGYLWTIILFYIGNRFLTKANLIKNSIAIIVPVMLIVVINVIMVNLRS